MLEIPTSFEVIDNLFMNVLLLIIIFAVPMIVSIVVLRMIRLPENAVYTISVLFALFVTYKAFIYIF